jgi:hypothetical protein
MTLKYRIIMQLFCLGVILFVLPCHAQQIEVLNNDQAISFRGLSAVTDQVVWVSGSKGTVGRSTDGGKTWKWNTVKGYEAREFRDIEAFDQNTAVILAVAEPAHILRTTDGGATWKVVYENNAKGMFLDAMDFVDDLHGTVIGDPVDGKFFLAHTSDGGITWKQEPPDHLPKIDSGEACFASSGTNIRRFGKSDYIFITGGKRSRVFLKTKPIDLPIVQGPESSGGNSIAIKQNKKTKAFDHWIVVGGDFAGDTIRTKNCFISKDFGKTWVSPAISPFGYRSCVEFISDTDLITCGIKGVDISSDDGMTWRNISDTGFHVCRKAKKGTTVFLAGGKGRIGKLIP